MKNLKLSLPFVILFISGASVFLLSFKTGHIAKFESQICLGPSVRTDDMHNMHMGAYDPNVYGEFAHSWFKRYTLTVSAPGGWHFTGDPYVNLVSQDQAAREGFGWNNFAGAHDRFFITQRTPNRIVATCWAGSHPMEINLACQATKD